jgi:exosortase
VFLGLIILSSLLFWHFLQTLVRLATTWGNEYDQYTHTLLIPFISLILVFLNRKRIFRLLRYDYAWGGTLMSAGIAVNLLLRRLPTILGTGNRLSLEIAALVLTGIGAFIGCYGRKAFQYARFPLLFLLCMVPLSDALLNIPVTIVRNGSSDVAFGVFSLLREPVFREGYVFTLSGVSIEVAQECSGVHSTLALIIVSLLSGHLFLSSMWKKIVLVAFALPIVCLTNGVRIGGLTMLAIHVDPAFLTGSLHHRGGIIFFSLALLLLFGLVFLLQKVGLDQSPGALSQEATQVKPAQPSQQPYI